MISLKSVIIFNQNNTIFYQLKKLDDYSWFSEFLFFQFGLKMEAYRIKWYNHNSYYIVVIPFAFRVSNIYIPPNQ